MTENDSYRNNWLVKLDGIAFPQLERYMSEEQAHSIVTDFIVAIKNTRTLPKVEGRRWGLQRDILMMAFHSALDLMDELGY